MTGRYPFRTGVCAVYGPAAEMDPTEITMAERLRELGYATGIFGKWHLGIGAEQSPNKQGFDEALTCKTHAMRQYFDPVLLHNGEEKRIEGYCMDIFTDAAIRFIREKREQPFFVYLPANLIHVPLQVPDELKAPFDGLSVSEATRKIYGMSSSLDSSFGRVRAVLEELGLEDDTLLIFTSDNGPCSSSKPLDRHMAGLRGLKGTVYQNGIRVPCFMRWPSGFSSPGKVTRLAAEIDLLPTVLDATGGTKDSGPALDGTSLLPLLRDPSATWPERMLFVQWDSGQVPRRGHAYAVLSEKWKLVQPCGMDAPEQKHIRKRYEQLCQLQGRTNHPSIEGPPRHELYDISADPGETTDLAGEHPEIVRGMTKQYDQWFTDVTSRWSTDPETSE
jgi:arylsulfatase/arylsulfatase A